MPDFKNLTLSDFYNMDIMVRSNGYRTPIVEVFEGKEIGLVGYNGSPELSDLKLREDAYNYYQRLIKELNSKIMELPDNKPEVDSLNFSKDLLLVVDGESKKGFYDALKDAYFIYLPFDEVEKVNPEKWKYFYN